MVLENPALTLSVGVQDILSILEAILNQRGWKDFELANLKLVYAPYYIFNYDILVEEEGEAGASSQGTSGLMAMNAMNGKLEPSLVDMLESQPLQYEKEISHDLEYEIEKPAITAEELKSSGRLKLAAQFSIKKDAVSISGVRLVYWPIWTVFVELGHMVQKIEVDGVSGVSLNIEQVPEREKGWMEVTGETLQKMKSPSGWAALTASVTTAAGRSLKKGVSTAGEKAAGEKTHSTMRWFISTKMGLYSLLLISILVLIVIMAME